MHLLVLLLILALLGSIAPLLLWRGLTHGRSGPRRRIGDWGRIPVLRRALRGGALLIDLARRRPVARGSGRSGCRIGSRFGGAPG